MASYVVTLGDTPSIEPLPPGGADPSSTDRTVERMLASPLIVKALCTPSNYLSAFVADDELVIALCSKNDVKIHPPDLIDIEDAVIQRIIASKALASHEGALLNAAWDGNIRLARALLDAGTDVNMSNVYGYGAPLRAATHNNLTDLVRLLLERGADPNRTSFEGNSCRPLYTAALNGNIDIVKLLIDYGADVNANNSAAFLQSIRRGHVGVFDLFLEKNVNIDTEDENGPGAPLRLAAKRGHWAICQRLIAHGAVVTREIYEQCHDAVKPLLGPLIRAADLRDPNSCGSDTQANQPPGEPATRDTDVFALIAEAAKARDMNRIRKFIQ